MKHAEVSLGHEYLSRVSGELVRVKVVTQTSKSVADRRDGKYGTRQAPAFVCKNVATGKTIVRRAAALRPVPEQPKPNPNIPMVKQLRIEWEAARRAGEFDLCLALRELSRAFLLEPNGGPMTHIATATLHREFPSHPSVTRNRWQAA